MDIQAIRQDFPILKRTVNNSPLIYFDNAATTQKPRQVIDAEVDFYEKHNGNVHRAVHTLSLEATDLYEKSREKVSKFINAKEPAELVFVRGTTEAINLVAYSWGLSNLGKGDEVLVSLMEHHSNIVPWEITSKLRGFTIKYANVKAGRHTGLQGFRSQIHQENQNRLPQPRFKRHGSNQRRQTHREGCPRQRLLDACRRSSVRAASAC